MAVMSLGVPGSRYDCDYSAENSRAASQWLEPEPAAGAYVAVGLVGSAGALHGPASLRPPVAALLVAGSAFAAVVAEAGDAEED